MSRKPNTALAEETFITKGILVDAIVGAGIPSITFAIKAEKAGLAVFTGNQYNEQWAWKRGALGEADIDALHDLYLTIKGVTHAR